MNIKVSPKFMINLIKKIDKTIWNEFKSYKEVEAYISRFREIDGYGYADFNIFYKDTENTQIDLYDTLVKIDSDETRFKIAVDIGLVIPDLIFAIPEIKGILSSDYEAAHITFENALKKVASEPNVSICCANSALESIIKHICEHSSIKDCKPKETLYKLTQHILKEFKFYPQKNLDDNIKNIGSSLLNIAQNIEAIRSNYSDTSHGKTSEDYIIDDELYAKFLVNTVTTVGLFLLNFFDKKYKHNANIGSLDDDVPF